jgi:energy-coupling factor transporter ATP-binding protein EcfA2
MDRHIVEELRIQSYGCIRDATFRLTSLHALIGPNDSGKSTVLRALRTLGFLTGDEKHDAGQKGVLLRAIETSGGTVRFEASSSGATWYIELSPKDEQMRWITGARGEPPPPLEKVMSWPFEPLRYSRPVPITEALAGAQMLRLDPDALRAPHALLQDGAPLRFVDERGTGLPAIYDAIMVRDIQAFLELNADVARLFPDVKSISPTNPSPTTKAIGVRLVDGTFVPAELMSEGLLYYLAFAALRHTERTPLLLVEEPENGLHPARIAEVMRVLRRISEDAQVIIATHSPLVVNELQPEEVTVVTRSREHGTQATRIQDTPGFEQRSKVYALGELWLSYANGEDEGPLLRGEPRPSLSRWLTRARDVLPRCVEGRSGG